MGSSFHLDMFEQDTEIDNLRKKQQAKSNSASQKQPNKDVTTPSINLQLAVAHKSSPVVKSNVVTLQKIAGNKAASSFVVQRNKTGGTTTAKKDIHDELKEYSEHAEKAENLSTNLVGNISSIVTPGAAASGIGTSIGSSLGQGGGMAATSGLGTILSGGSLVSDSASLHNRLTQWHKAKKGNLKDVEHITKRKAKIAGANVGTDVGNFSSGVVNTAASPPTAAAPIPKS